MASEYSSKLKFELIGSGEQAGLWGTTTNKNLGELVEQAIAGVTNLKLDSYAGIKVLDSLDGVVDQARSAVINCYYDLIPASGAVSVVVPTSTKLYLARNSCGQTVTFKTAAQIGGVEIATGESTLIFCNGASVVQGIATGAIGIRPVSQGGTGTDNFGAGGFIRSPGTTSALTAQSSINLASDVGTTILPVANGGTGVTGFTNGQLLIGTTGGAIATLNGGISGYVPIWNGSAWVPGAQATGAVTSVNGLTGAVSITTSSIGAYPTSNPSGYITSSSLSGYALLSGASFSGAVSASGFTATGAGSIGDQKFAVSYGGYSTGVSPQGMQLGASGKGIIYDGSNIALGGISGGTVLTIGASTGYFVCSTDNAQKPSGGSWLTTSDARLKDNITPYTKGLDAVKSLRTVTFTLKDNVPGREHYMIDSTKVITGIVAQEALETPLSSMISESSDGYYMVDSSELTWTLVNAVKELSAKVDAQAKQITALEEQVINLGVK